MDETAEMLDEITYYTYNFLLSYSQVICPDFALAVSNICPDWYQGPPAIARGHGKNWEYRVERGAR